MNVPMRGTVTKSRTGSWAVHVYTLNAKKVLLGTYNTEQDARAALEKHLNPAKRPAQAPEPASAAGDDEPPPPKQRSLF